MKKVLIIAPHFPPSNLAAVHRSRLFAQHLPAFGWQPIILTVDEKYYEEAPDENLVKLLSPDLIIEKVRSFKITKPRLIGDIGLRSFLQLLRKTIELVKKKQVDFLYIPVPSFYTALIGRIAHARTGITYGIDYIDPWVHTFPGSDKIFSRHWWSTRISKWLEPIAVKKAKLISGVAEGYYQGVLQRNPHLKSKVQFVAMPYGGEETDHTMVTQLNLVPYLFKKNNKMQLVYAGAMLPKAYKPLEEICKTIAENRELFSALEIHFIGSGKSPNDINGYNIRPVAERYNLWQSVMFEYPARIPYLDVLIHLNNVSGVFILGSTEAHYTPSKVYQAVLSHKPIWAILHRESTACGLIRSTNTGEVLAFDGEGDVRTISHNLIQSFRSFADYSKHYDAVQINTQAFEAYSAKAVTGILANALNKVVNE